MLFLAISSWHVTRRSKNKSGSRRNISAGKKITKTLTHSALDSDFSPGNKHGFSDPKLLFPGPEKIITHGYFQAQGLTRYFLVRVDGSDVKIIDSTRVTQKIPLMYLPACTECSVPAPLGSPLPSYAA